MSNPFPVTVVPEPSKFPIQIDTTVGGGFDDVRITTDEARQLAEALLDAVAEAEDSTLVQVELGPFGVVYTYRDPSGQLQPGDRVTVSGVGRRHLGAVVARGRGEYQGEVYEHVTGKVVPLS